MRNKDYYRILGLAENATAAEIKQAYRKLAKDNHPDAHPGDRVREERFKEISEAYSVLKDAQKRKQYDQMRRFGFPGAGGGFSNPGGPGFGFDLGDIFGPTQKGRRRTAKGDFNFDDFFGFGGLGDLFTQIFQNDVPHGNRAGSANQDLDIRANLSIPFETAALGGKTVFSINKNVVCNSCHGVGTKPGAKPQVCSQCRGTGTVSMARGGFAVNRPCPRCFGRGSFVAEPCLTCGGTGQTKSEKKYSVNIESGTENGKKICLRGQGNPSLNGRPPGDLVLTIKVEPHRFFMSKGLDIHCEIPIDQKRAKHGTKVRVKTIYGSTVELQVPRNTINGKVFRLKGMGVKRKETSGDQFVKITVA